MSAYRSKADAVEGGEQLPLLTHLYEPAAFRKWACLVCRKSQICIRPVWSARGPWPWWEYACTVISLADRLVFNPLGHQIPGAVIDPFHAVCSVANWY